MHSVRGILQNLSEGQKTGILTALVIITNVFGNVLLSHGMRQGGPIVSASPLDYVRSVISPWAIAGILILAAFMILDLALLSRADLSFVLPMTASAYVLVALIGTFLFHEKTDTWQWLGILVISIGAALAGETPPKTTPEKPEDVLR